MTAFRDSEILNTVVRMVVPMRREFGRNLDVAQFLRDRDYAKTVLDEALGSSEQRLRDYAAYVSARMAGARVATAPIPQGAPEVSKADAQAQASPAEGSTESAPDPARTGAAGTSREDELKARVMRKYTTGLR